MFEIIKEGDVNIRVQKAKIVSKQLEVFYNPKMERNRTLSVLILKTYNKEQLTIGLPLAGTGIRAARFLKELPSTLIKKIAINDLNPKSKKLIQKNLEENNLLTDNVSIHSKDANLFLEESTGFDYIDIDPFGSPNFLLDTAIKRLSRKGILAVTATDTGALAGTYPQACKFKYWATSAICPQKHEMGLRILIRKVQLVGTQHTKALTPLFVYHHEHYYRIFFQASKGRTKAAEIFDKTNSYFAHCPSCQYHQVQNSPQTVCPNCQKKMAVCGQLYTGPLGDSTFIKKLITNCKEEKLIKFLEQVETDTSLEGVGYYDTHVFCKCLGIPANKLEEYQAELEKNNFQVVRVMTNDVGLRTNAPYTIVKKSFEKVYKTTK